MAAPSGRPEHDLIRRLEEEGPRFSFVQAVRLLERLRPDAARVGRQGPVSREAVRLRPSLEVAFPTADVARIRRIPGPDGDRHEVTATFLGLYGSVSPLPSYFSEMLLELQDEESLLRNFLDLFHHRLLSLFYRCWEKYRHAAQFEAGGSDPVSACLLDLLAVDPERVPRGHRLKPVRLLGFAGLLTQQPRSAAVLRSMLADLFEDLDVRVEPWVGRRIPVPADQRARLGTSCSRLGRDLTVGDRVFDRGCTFRVALGPLNLAEFLDFLPGGARLQELREAVDLANADALDYEVELRLRRDEVPPLRLSSPSSRLGWSTWLGRSEGPDPRVRFLVKGWFHGRG